MTFTITLHPAFTCGQCGDACGHLFQHGDLGLCLGCELEFDEWKNRLIAEYEAREAEEGWGESPLLHSEGIDYYVDTTLPQSDLDWSGAPAEVAQKGSLRLGDVTRAVLVDLAQELRKLGLTVHPIGRQMVEVRAQVAA